MPKSPTYTRATLFLSFLALLATSAAHAQTPVSTAAEPARPYSYVFLDPLEGQHHMPASDGNRVGVELHGHWVIDVRNPDGSLAERRDFENTITNYGQELLVALMSGSVVPSDYGIFLSSTGTAPCPALTGFQGCGIVHSTTTLPGSALCPNYTCALGLTYATAINEQTGSPATSFTLAGTITAGNAGTITGVSTLYGTCPANLFTVNTQTSIAPTTCSTTPGSGGYRTVSAATVTTVNVVASQIVQVTVTFTFS